MLPRSTSGLIFVDGDGMLARISSRRRVWNSGCFAKR